MVYLSYFNGKKILYARYFSRNLLSLRMIEDVVAMACKYSQTQLSLMILCVDWKMCRLVISLEIVFVCVVDYYWYLWRLVNDE